MIRTFADPETERIWRGERGRKLPPDIQNRAFIRLKMLDAAEALKICAIRRAIGYML